MSLQVFIVNRDRLTPLVAMIDWLLPFDVDVVILDNDSTYPPLLRWYQECSVNVIRFNRNFGHAAAWDTGIISTIARGEFVLTQSDLDLSGIPVDWIEVLREGLRKYPRKGCGFSLAIDDLPDHSSLKDEIIQSEAKFWCQRLCDRFYAAEMDTTFALYSVDSAHGSHVMEGVRAAPPYTARYLPWYCDFKNLSDEERHCIQHSSDCKSWTSRIGRAMPSQRVERRGGVKRQRSGGSRCGAKSLPRTCAGLWAVASARHLHWEGQLFLFENGALVAGHNGDTGEWKLTEPLLTLSWSRWAAETVRRVDEISFASDSMELRLVEAGDPGNPLDLLQDAALILVHRGTTADRDANLCCTVRHAAKSFPGLEIIVVEQDGASKVAPGSLPEGVRYVFTFSEAPFNRAWGFNVGAKATDRPLLIFSDADIVLSCHGFLEALCRTNSFDVVKPYNALIGLSEEESVHFRRSLDPGPLPERGPNLIQLLCSGAVLITRGGFNTVGGWPEEFEGWGGEDDAQSIKVSRALQCSTVVANAHHLHHSRTRWDGPSQPEYRTNLSRLEQLNGLGPAEIKALSDRTLERIGRRDRYANRASPSRNEPLVNGA